MSVTGEASMPSSASVIAPGEVATPITEQRPFEQPREALKAVLQPENISEAVRNLARLPKQSRPGRQIRHPAGHRIG
jgi:hypothetical protein